METHLSKPQVSIRQSITYGGRNRELETSKYPEEKERNLDFQSSGEQKWKSPNRGACTAGSYGLHKVLESIAEQFWKSDQREI